MNERQLEATGGRDGYERDLFENLIYRYEEPNGMNRWDSPLFVVTYDDVAPPTDQIWDAIIGSGTQMKTVKPNAVTVMVSLRHINLQDPTAKTSVRHQLQKQTIFTTLTKPHKRSLMLY